jgi:hypothetical protein
MNQTMTNGRFKYWMYDNYLWIVAALLIAGIVIHMIASVLGRASIEILISWTGIVVAFFYFIHKQGLEEVRLFNELFKECNARYDGLNEQLNRIVSENKELSVDEKNLLYDYFNLCGEEYIYYRRGYIYPEVWTAWCNGMKYFMKNGYIKKLWEEEERLGSYYGLTLAEIERKASLAG